MIERFLNSQPFDMEFLELLKYPFTPECAGYTKRRLPSSYTKRKKKVEENDYSLLRPIWSAFAACAT